MEKLDLNENMIKDEGARLLTTCLHNLKRLDLLDHFYSEKVTKSLVENSVGCQVVFYKDTH